MLVKKARRTADDPYQPNPNRRPMCGHCHTRPDSFGGCSCERADDSILSDLDDDSLMDATPSELLRTFGLSEVTR